MPTTSLSKLIIFVVQDLTGAAGDVVAADGDSDCGGGIVASAFDAAASTA